MKETTINRMFLNRIEEGRDEVRYIVPRDGKWEPMTYREVGEAAREMAGGLMSLGLARGEKVAILCSTRVEWSLSDIASILGGFVTVPIYPSNLPDQVEYILSHSRARVVFVEDETQWNKVAGSRGRLPELDVVILLTGDSVGKAGTIGLSDLRSKGAAYSAAHPGAIAERTGEIRPEDDLTIIYTSGTTGPPKGAVIRHSNIAFDVTSTLSVVRVPRGDVMLQFLPLAHVLGRFEHFLSFDAMAVSAFARGIQTVAEDLPAVRPHMMVSVPRLYEKFYAAVLAKVNQDGGLKKRIFMWALSVGREVSARKQRRKPVGGLLAAKFSLAERLVFGKIRGRLGGRLRFFVSGGAPLAREIAEFFHAMGILILEGYGLTETPSVTSCNQVGNFKFGTVGPPIPGVEVRIAQDGEILIRGPHVFKEYYSDPAATKEAIDPEGWFHSGDIGAIDEEGFLRITDRKKDIIVTSGGKNVAPQNIENLLKTDKMVSQAFVYGDRRKYLTAILTLSPEEIVKWAQENGIAERDPALLAGSPRVEEMMRARVDEINRSLAPFEQVKKFVLLGTDFSQETGELTPTLKVKRKVVIRKYGALLDALYEKD
ncbi:MAG: long-chain fatty acid--CoA ligase [Deltaproteobacteria bacterium]|nr:long-chain fatty acid--CoA ligase [Deltaproteobacteria bacterium]